MSLRTDEPLVTRASVTAVAAAVVALAVSFGLDLTAAQQAAITAVVAAAAPLAAAWWARRHVTPTAKVPEVPPSE